MIKTHINDAKPFIGMKFKSIVCSLIVSGNALANNPAKISEIAVAVNITPIIRVVYFFGANFEMKLNAIGITNNSPTTRNMENNRIHTICILTAPPETYRDINSITNANDVMIKPYPNLEIEEGSIFLSESIEMNLIRIGPMNNY